MLLVLRGLLGDAMAMGMAPVQPVADMAQTLQAAGDEGHSAHASQAMEQHCCDSMGEHHLAHQGGCSACGICHSVLGVTAWMATLTTAQRHTPRPPRGAQFASAPAAQAIKPPIV